MDKELELRIASAAGNTDAVGKINRRYSEDQARDPDGRFGSGSGDQSKANAAEKASSEKEHSDAARYHANAAKKEWGTNDKKAEAHYQASNAHATAAYYHSEGSKTGAKSNDPQIAKGASEKAQAASKAVHEKYGKSS